RQDVRRKRREFASDFDKWTRGNGKEQQQDGKSSSRDAKIERGGIESDKQRNKHEHDEHKEKSQRNSQKSRARDEGLKIGRATCRERVRNEGEAGRCRHKGRGTARE